MRFAAVGIATLAVFGCSGETARQLSITQPSTATAPAPTLHLTVVVIGADFSGACLEGAVVEIVWGQSLGTQVTQTTPCSYWDPDYGATFRGLNPYDLFTLRVSAPGYVAAEQVIVPEQIPGTRILTFALSRIQ
jgi:hypothetical protein